MSLQNLKTTRRLFLKSSGAFGLIGAANMALAGDRFLPSQKLPWKLQETRENVGICCFCAGGCGVITSTRNGKIVNVEGDPDNPINLGGLCAKGSSLIGLCDIIDKKGKLVPHPYRLTQPLVRRPGKSEWEPISWSNAINEMARTIKKTRDETFTATDNGVTVNRTQGIAGFGCGKVNNEECFAFNKFCRSLGMVEIDNQARVCESSTVSGLSPSFGRGAMTNNWCDFKNSDVYMTIGSNNCENHPLSSRWIHRGIDKGAKWIVVDPRFTRTASQADIYAHIRPGTDIAFFGGLMNYILSNGLYQKEYVLNYTNASYLIDPAFGFDPETGFFSGWDPEAKNYKTRTWKYQLEKKLSWKDAHGEDGKWVNDPGVPKFTPPDELVPKKDPTLQDPNCVLNLMAKHYSRYTIDKVSLVTGIEKNVLEKVYETFASTGAPGKSGSIIYALGQAQHHYGSQNCRSMCMVQLLLGNIGVAGGGINALRGESNVQGSTDMGIGMDSTPGYLAWPIAEQHPNLTAYLNAETPGSGFYINKPKLLVSMLKEWYGDNATVDNDYCYDLWPKRTLAHNDSTMPSFHYMNQNQCKGYIVVASNPATSTPNAKFAREAMRNLDWLIVADWFPTETATFWKAPGMDPAKINTTVYMLPAAMIFEKEGSITNSGRWIQWRQKAVEPMGDAKSDFEILSLLFLRLQQLYRKEGGACPEQVTKVNWNYRNPNGKLDVLAAAHALNGYNTKTGKLIKSFSDLKADGSTACGLWIYSGYYNNDPHKWEPMMQPCTRRSMADPTDLALYSGWCFSWPANRRILYNRASCNMQGKPWNPEKTLVEWNGSSWKCNDVPDFVASEKLPNGTVVAVPPNNKAFDMTWEECSRLFAQQMVDGPFSEAYEPFESPTKNVFNGHQNDPMIQFTDLPGVNRGSPEEFPIVATTYAMAEHWQSGVQTRNQPWLVQIMPRPFIEISKELAEEKGIKNGDVVRIFNRRASVQAFAMVTVRFKPLMINGKKTHVIGLIRHWSWQSCYSTGDTMNDLTPNVGDGNSFIPEYKAFLVNIEKVA